MIIRLRTDEIKKLEEHFESQLKILQYLQKLIKNELCKKEVQKDIDFFENMLVALADAMVEI